MEQPAYGGLSADDVDLPGAGSANTGIVAAPFDSDAGLPGDGDHLTDGSMPQPDLGPVGRPVRQAVFTAGQAWSQRRVSEQTSVTIDDDMLGAATVVAGVMGSRSASQADAAANAQAETVRCGSLRGPEKKEAQNRRHS
jgi:hypothetical protein